MTTLVDTKTSRLWRACLAGDANSVDNELTTAQPDAMALDRNGETCLHMAVRGGQVKALERLLQEGLRIDQPNNNGQTPLHVAVTLNLANIVKSIVRHSGDLDSMTKCSGMTALHLACRHGHEDLAHILLDSGANCAVKDKIHRWPDNYTVNPTILAIFQRHFEVCTHGRGKGKTEKDTTHGSSTTTSDTRHHDNIKRDHAGTAVIDDDEAVARIAKQWKKAKGRSEMERGEIRHGEVEITDERASYNPERDGQDSGLIKHSGKKIKVNHKMDFSDQHRQRMQQNVFDRLLRPPKKT